jgi:hypothetical protein
LALSRQSSQTYGLPSETASEYAGYRMSMCSFHALNR